MKKLLLIFVLPFFLMLLHSKTALSQACPNGDFESWNITPYSQPDSSWFTSNPQSLLQADSLTVWPVTGFSGQAVHIESAVIGTDSLMAYITNAPGNPQGGIGGVPYSQTPTAITGYYRYNMVGGDSAVIFVLFKKAGVAVSTNTYKISNASGSLSTFTAFSLPLATLSMAPDSVIVAAASSNILTGGPVHPGSWLELDQLGFTTSQPIPGGSFNTWLPDSLFDPINWSTGAAGGDGNGVYRSANHYSGNYSVALISQPNGGGNPSQPVAPAIITTGTIPIGNGGSNNPTGGLPYTLTSDTLSGWYEYIPAGIDTAGIQISQYAAGAQVGGGSSYLMATSSWTYFSIPLSSLSTPDTMRIDVYSTLGFATIPGSVLYLDHMQLSSRPLGISRVVAAPAPVIAYPNPASDILNLRLDNNSASPASVQIYDMMGRILDSRSYNVAPGIITFPVGYLPSGLYFYEVNNNGTITRDKFMKE